MDNIQPGLFGRMSQGHYLPTEAQTSGKSSTKWLKQGRVYQNGQCLMHNTLECPKDVEDCSLSLALILQSPADVQKKYYLSSKAAEGILRRANRNGKTLPEKLQLALERVANVVHETAKGTEQ